MKKAAVLLDGDQVRRHLRRVLKRDPTEQDVWLFAQTCVRTPDEDLFRIYYYDCPPYEKAEWHPLKKATEDFGNSMTSIRRRAFNEKLSRMDHIAFRSGVLSFKGWRIGRRATEDLIGSHGRALMPEDLEPDFEQKRVDMKIGLDAAWLSSKRIVDRIILATADSDFIPAMKFARREGVQIVLVRVGRIKQEMLEHADEVRDVTFPPKTAGNP